MINTFNLNVLSSLDLAGIQTITFHFIMVIELRFYSFNFLASKFRNSLGYIDIRSTYQMSILQWQYWLLTKLFKPFLLTFDLWLNFDSSI